MIDICKICNEKHDLRTHLKVHSITSKEYYDRFIKKPDEGICPVCGKETKFLGITKGYRTWCSNKCHQNDLTATENRVAAYKASGGGSSAKKQAWQNKTQEEKTEIVNKLKTAVNEKYGVEFYSQTAEWKDRIPQKIAESNKSYGADFWEKNHVDNLKKYCENNNIDYTDYKNVFQIAEIKEAAKNTKLKKYNNANFNNVEKMQNTNIAKYGYKYAILHPELRNKIHKKYTYDGKQFDSMPEMAYYIWLTENNINFTYQPDISFEYTHNEKTHKYFPDFLVNDELQEIKGSHFFEEHDVNKRMINPFDSSLNELFEAKHRCMIEHNVKILTEAEYGQYINYVNKKYTPDFLPLFANNLPFPYLNEDLHDKSDMGLIHHFHKSIYEATRKGKLSPITAWNDKNIVKKVALNRLKYVGRCKPSDILQGFNVTRIANKVSIFKPKIAEYLIEKYLSEATAIIDPFSGFSGRMLGAFNAGKKYIGWDINETHVKESNEIIKFKNIGNRCSVNVLDLLSAQAADWTNSENNMLFTCPPYGGKEHWNENNDEIEKTCDEWIDLCLKKHRNCNKYLFVVDKTEKYKNNIVETITNKSHFGENTESVILI